MTKYIPSAGQMLVLFYISCKTVRCFTDGGGEMGSKDNSSAGSVTWHTLLFFPHSHGWKHTCQFYLSRGHPLLLLGAFMPLFIQPLSTALLNSYKVSNLSKNKLIQNLVLNLFSITFADNQGKILYSICLPPLTLRSSLTLLYPRHLRKFKDTLSL